VFLPYGIYLLSDTVTLKPDTAIIGEGMPHLMLMDGAPGFGNARAPKPMLLAPSNADATTVLADLALTSQCVLPMLEAGPPSPEALAIHTVSRPQLCFHLCAVALARACT
jgi:hypothetical protein